MPQVSRTFTTTATPSAAYAYLADFTNTEQWDPGTQTCRRVEGDGGISSRYRNVSRFLGRTVEVEYVAEELQPDRLVHFVGRRGSFEGHDRLSLASSGEGAEVTYDAVFEFGGLSRLAGPLVGLLLRRIAAETVISLRGRLDALSTPPRG